MIGNRREVVGLRKDGTTFPIELSVGEVETSGCRSFTGIIRDITERKRLEKQIVEASERQQQRIGRSLHDGLCQELAGVMYLVKTMQHKLQATEIITKREVNNVASLLQNTLTHARTLARSLHPVDSLPTGLIAALRHLAADTSSESRISCQFRCARRVEIHDPALATHLYRIAQECVRNAVELAKANRIMLRLICGQKGITLSISNNAVTSKRKRAQLDRMATEMIEHRAHMIGGRIAVQPRRGGGSRINCHVFQRQGA